MKRRRVAISGLPLFCEQVASEIARIDPSWEPVMLRTQRHRHVLQSLVKLAGADVWYSIGSPFSDRWVDWLARLLRKPRVIHWVGSDITSAQLAPGAISRVSGAGIRHLAEVDFTAEELRALGVQSSVIPLPPRHRAVAVAPLPQRFTVLLYLPRSRNDFYGRREYERLMERLRDKDIRWLIVGGGSLRISHGVNAENLGWNENLERIYNESSVLIRHTEHDGLSLMVLEALSFGRHIIWSQEFPFTRCSRNYDELEAHVLDLYARHAAGTLAPQPDAAELVRNRYAPETCISEIVATWRAAMGTP